MQTHSAGDKRTNAGAAAGTACRAVPATVVGGVPAGTAPAAPQPRRLPCPFMLAPVAAGFPSPADDFVDHPIDLNEKLIHNPPATFFVRASGESMIGAGIFPGDTLVVDRSLTARDGMIIVALVDGQFTVKRYRRQGFRVILEPENPEYPPLEVTGDRTFEIWGVVTSAIRRLCRF